MRSLGEEFEYVYSKDFGDMCHRLKITPDSAYSTFISVCEELFKGKVEWGHIVALFAFAGGLALECHQQNYPELVGLVADWTATFVETHLDVWIAQRGGWVSTAELVGHLLINILTFLLCCRTALSISTKIVAMWRVPPTDCLSCSQSSWRKWMKSLDSSVLPHSEPMWPRWFERERN